MYFLQKMEQKTNDNPPQKKKKKQQQQPCPTLSSKGLLCEYLYLLCFFCFFFGGGGLISFNKFWEKINIIFQIHYWKLRHHVKSYCVSEYLSIDQFRCEDETSLHSP